jgi:hypothetical protein
MKTRIACLGTAVILSGAHFLWSPSSVSAADISFSPSFAVSEEFTDNVFEGVTNKRNEFITRVQPGFTSRYQAPFWNWDLAYNFDYRRYERNSRGDEYTHNGVLRGNLTLLDNFLILDVSDTYHRVTLDVSRNATTESSLFLNQTDQNIATVSPYLLWRMGDKSTLKTGYRFTDVRYWGEGIERREHGAFADFNRQISSQLSLTAGYGFTRLESQPTRYNKHDVSGGFRFEYAEKSFVYGQVGNSWQQYENSTDVSYIFWNAGLTHDLGFAVATLETRVQTATDPLAVSTKETIYSGRLEKTLQRGSIGFGTTYSEYANTLTDSMNRRRLGFTGTGRYEVVQDLSASLAVTAERFYSNTLSDFPYHLNATAGLSYLFNRGLTLALNYTYDTQRSGFDTARGAIETNRAVVEVRKTF